jgi:hypothetical protein
MVGGVPLLILYHTVPRISEASDRILDLKMGMRVHHCESYRPLHHHQKVTRFYFQHTSSIHTPVENSYIHRTFLI